jgi:hypothetical protein
VSGSIAPCILSLGTRRRWVVSFTPRLIYPRGNIPLYLLDRWLGGPQSHSGCGGKEKKRLHCPCRVMNPSRPARSLLTQLPKLHWSFIMIILWIYIYIFHLTDNDLPKEPLLRPSSFKTNRAGRIQSSTFYNIYFLYRSLNWNTLLSALQDRTIELFLLVIKFRL